ncbi:protein tyrosine phosphatase [Colwellia sp. MT41]|uniref:Protein-tyrosine-phosphatase n=1 Tax=Colwellia marinimaniae TaxID=1513592 RepID=A0ABQ0MZ53_9GAMM|nr:MULTISPECIES: low molecular weight protein-tyrosine-phosphatase [Colwellia]ALO34586.1 protein tyrosine phosphatase [Colwellia sp. MT41]GAW97614.1 protein-tyrosine-phosphatase [Colwellia marinimaniae]
MTNKTLNIKGINSVLFICMGNICRSPSAEAVFRHKMKAQGLSLKVDSAGTLGAHAKEKPDHRAQKAGIARGYSFDGIKARQVTVQDFSDFDLILAMDHDNIDELKKIAPPAMLDKIHLMLDFAVGHEEEQVPDPYYGGAKGFDYVLDLVEAASDGLLAKM